MRAPPTTWKTQTRFSKSKACATNSKKKSQSSMHQHYIARPQIKEKYVMPNCRMDYLTQIVCLNTHMKYCESQREEQQATLAIENNTFKCADI